MLEIPDKNDINMIETEIRDLKSQIDNMRNQIQDLMKTHEAMKNLVSTIGGNYTTY